MSSSPESIVFGPMPPMPVVVCEDLSWPQDSEAQVREKTLNPRLCHSCIGFIEHSARLQVPVESPPAPYLPMSVDTPPTGRASPPHSPDLFADTSSSSGSEQQDVRPNAVGTDPWAIMQSCKPRVYSTSAPAHIPLNSTTEEASGFSPMSSAGPGNTMCPYCWEGGEYGEYRCPIHKPSPPLPGCWPRKRTPTPSPRSEGSFQQAQDYWNYEPWLSPEREPSS